MAKHFGGITWREIFDTIREKGGDEALDLPAYIYIDGDSDVDMGGLTNISAVLPCYMTYEGLDWDVSDEDNPVFVTVQDKE